MTRICFTGPSGTGKTTLANYVKNRFGMEFVSSSASDVIHEANRDRLRDEYGYEPSGHANVIKRSAIDPDFGLDFQQSALIGRREKFKEKTTMVSDRCFIDNMVYFNLQVGYQVDPKITRGFMRECMESMELIDIVFYVPINNPDEIETNGSRVDSLWYQKAVDGAFHNMVKDAMIYSTTHKFKTQFYKIDFWNLQSRETFVLETIKGHGLEPLENR